MAVLGGLAHPAGHAGSHGLLKDCRREPLFSGERESMEPMAARLHSGRVHAARQLLPPLVAKAAWHDEAVLGEVRRRVLPAVGQRWPILAWPVVDFGTSEKSRHLVVVARKDRGRLGKPENCQGAVSLSAATREASLTISCWLHLPGKWAHGREWRRRAGVPEKTEFKTMPEFALGLMRQAVEENVPARNCGEVSTRMGLALLLAAQSGLSLWRPGMALLLPGRPQRRGQRNPVSVSEPVRELSEGVPDGVLAKRRTRGPCVPILARCKRSRRTGTIGAANHKPGTGCWWSGRPQRKGPRNAGCRICPRRRR